MPMSELTTAELLNTAKENSIIWEENYGALTPFRVVEVLDDDFLVEPVFDEDNDSLTLGLNELDDRDFNSKTWCMADEDDIHRAMEMLTKWNG